MRTGWTYAIIIVTAAAATIQTARLLRADPPTTPRSADADRAARVTTPASGTDEREAPAPRSIAAGDGVVEPAQPETRVGAPIAGQIAAIAVSEGQRIAAGDTLVELDRRVEAAALAASEADVAAAKAELDRTVRGSRVEELRAARAESEVARSRSDLAAGIAERTAKAAGVGAVTGEELERARGDATAAAASAPAAAAREATILAGAREEDVRLARARLAAAEARRDQARAAHARLRVTSPIAGEVLSLPFRAGEYYQPGADPIAIIGDTSQLRVRAEIDERDVGKVRLGQIVVVRAEAFADDFRGRIVEIGRRMGRQRVRNDDPKEKRDTRVLEVVVALDSAGALVVAQRVTCFVLP